MKKATTSKKSQSKSAATKSISTDPALMELFTDSIKDIYYAEKQLVKSLPRLQKASTSEKLREALGEHVEVTKAQVGRLEQVFELLGKKPQGKKCEAMDGLTKEGQEIIASTEKGTSTRDVGIILASQKVEHYEIATYGGLAQLATTLGLEEIALLLGETLNEEKETDALLTEIAENDINYEAAEEE